MADSSRRVWVAGLAASALGQVLLPGPPARARLTPMLCVNSKNLKKLHYSELPPIVKAIGFEGCDLTVYAGGHVEPSRAPADLVRAIEGLQGEGVELPMITTDLTSAMDPYARGVLGLAGPSKVPLYKTGYYRYLRGEDLQMRLMQTKAQLMTLVSLGRAYGMCAGLPNLSGEYVGGAVWDTQMIIGDIDPRGVGYCFDPCHAAAAGGNGGWKIALRLALPRLKVLEARDFYWEKAGGKWQMRMCPLGQGMVEWQEVFRMLAAARFTGPVSLHVEYEAKDELRATETDLGYLKKVVAAAYG